MSALTYNCHTQQVIGCGKAKMAPLFGGRRRRAICIFYPSTLDIRPKDRLPEMPRLCGIKKQRTRGHSQNN